LFRAADSYATFQLRLLAAGVAIGAIIEMMKPSYCFLCAIVLKIADAYADEAE